MLAGTALSSLMLGLVLPGEGVRAQEGEQPVAVFDRARPAFDPKGIDLGGFRLYPSAAASETYDDNIFADDSGEQDDFITAVSAALLAESEWSRHEVKMDARVRHEAFIDNSDQDRTEYFLRPTVRFDLGERDTARLTAEHSRRVIGRDDPEDAGDEEPTEFNRFLAGGEYIHRVNRVFFGFNAEGRRDDYISGGDDDRDRNEYRFGLPVGYEVSAITDVKLEPFVRVRDFDELDSTGADRDAKAAGATVGFDTELTRLLHLNFDVGFVANDYEDSRFNDSVDLIFG
ncbi:MAG: outer membrane beta-barrel protein, partial [Oricola sp.]